MDTKKDKDLLIPVAHCDSCDESVPVIIDNIPVEEFELEPIFENERLEIIICAVCFSFLNEHAVDVKVDFYEKKDLPKVINYKVAE